MTWRVAKSLLKLRRQVNEAAPHRSTSCDGTIGDEKHQSRVSDHNPWVKDGKVGVVTAMDITHDPEHGLDSYKLAETLCKSRDRRIKYIISKGRISSAVRGWDWRGYDGSNPHDKHVHISVTASKLFYDNEDDWDIGLESEPKEVPMTAAVVKLERPKLKRGASGEAVRTLQRLLGVAVDGRFGLNTTTLVRRFQRAHGLKADGIVGPYTWDALEKDPAIET